MALMRLLAGLDERPGDGIAGALRSTAGEDRLSMLLSMNSRENRRYGQREDGTTEPTIGIEQIVEPLKRNMARAGDYGFDSIRGLGNVVPLWVENSGDRLLELFLEPVGQDYWLRPGESVVVTSYGHWDDHPFETAHEPGRITVWCTSWFATVTDRTGQEVPGAHQRPDGVY